MLVRGPLPWVGDEGFKKAEVTGGGVDLADVDPQTMESRKHKGLFLCGEMLDAFGPIGGYNFLWAWATGRAAGLGAAATRIPLTQRRKVAEFFVQANALRLRVSASRHVRPAFECYA